MYLNAHRFLSCVVCQNYRAYQLVFKLFINEGKLKGRITTVLQTNVSFTEMQQIQRIGRETIFAKNILPSPSFSSCPSPQSFEPSRSFSGSKHSPDEHENWPFRHWQFFSSEPSKQSSVPSHLKVLLMHCKFSH